MTTENTILLTNTGVESLDSSFSYGDRKKGAGYHKNNNGVHTIVCQFDNFAGTVKIQGSLSLYPGDNDWFDIYGTEIGGDSSVFSSTVSRSFTGKFVWIRAAYNVQNGTITEIRYNC